MNNKQKKSLLEYGSLATFALIFIPIGTYLFATKESPVQYTMSMIGNRFGHRLSFIIWGGITSLMLTFFVARLFWLKSFKHKKARKFLIRSLIFLFLTVIIPAMDSLPILSGLHTLTAIAFALSLMAALFLFSKHLKATNQKAYNWSNLFLYFIIFGSLLMLFIFGNTGIFELFFFFSLSFFLFFINRVIKFELLKKNKQKF